MPDEWTIEADGGTVAYAHKPERRHYAGATCDRHGKLERLDPGAIEVVLNGTTFGFDPSAPFEDGDGVELGCCRECLDVTYRTHDRREADDIELLTDAIAEEWTNPYRKGVLDTGLFRVLDVDPAAATVEFCPYCASAVERSGDRVECPVHGELAVDVRAALEAPEP